MFFFVCRHVTEIMQKKFTQLIWDRYCRAVLTENITWRDDSNNSRISRKCDTSAPLASSRTFTCTRVKLCKFGLRQSKSLRIAYRKRQNFSFKRICWNKSEKTSLKHKKKVYRIVSMPSHRRDAKLHSGKVVELIMTKYDDSVIVVSRTQ